MINIILAEDHSLVRKGIKRVLETDPDMFIVGEAVSGIEVLDQLKRGINANLIVTDLTMPDMGGMALLKAVREEYQDLIVMILTMDDTENSVVEAFKNGADSYLLKNIGANELRFAISHVSSGGKYISADLSQKLLRNSHSAVLPPLDNTRTLTFSSRELEVLELISEGFTNLEMSEKLFLSRRTVEGHRQSLIDKTKCKNTASLIRYAVSYGLIA